MATYGTLRRLRNVMLVSCAHGALVAVAWTMLAADARADRTIVIGGPGSGGGSGTVVISGSGASRQPAQLAAVPGGGSVQVDLSVIQPGGRIRLRPPVSAASGSVALRPPGPGPVQLAQDPYAAPQRIVLRPPVPRARPALGPSPAPSVDYADRSGSGTGGYGTNADTAALNRTQLAEVSQQGTLRVSIPAGPSLARRPELRLPGSSPEPLSPEPLSAAPLRAAPPSPAPLTAAPPPAVRSPIGDDRRAPRRDYASAPSGEDARSLNLAVLAAVEPATSSAPAPLSVAVAPPPAPFGGGRMDGSRMDGVGMDGAGMDASRTRTPADDLRPEVVSAADAERDYPAASPVPVAPPSGPERDTPPPAATVGATLPTRQPPQPVAPHQQTAALPPDPEIAPRPTIYWTSPRVDAPPPPAGMPRIASSDPAPQRMPAADGERSLSGPMALNTPPEPIVAEPLAAEPLAPEALAPEPAAPEPEAPPPPSVAMLPPERPRADSGLRPLPPVPTETYEPPARGESDRYGMLSDRAFDDAPYRRYDRPSGSLMQDVDLGKGGGLIGSLMGRPDTARSNAIRPLPALPPAPTPYDDMSDTASSRPGPGGMEPERSSPVGRRALSPEEQASLAAVGGSPATPARAPYGFSEAAPSSPLSEPPPALAPHIAPEQTSAAEPRTLSAEEQASLAAVGGPPAIASPEAMVPAPSATQSAALPPATLPSAEPPPVPAAGLPAAQNVPGPDGILWTSPPQRPAASAQPKPFTPDEVSTFEAAGARAAAATPAPRADLRPETPGSYPVPAVVPQADPAAPARGPVRTPPVAALPELPPQPAGLDAPRAATAVPARTDRLAALPAPEPMLALPAPAPTPAEPAPAVAPAAAAPSASEPRSYPALPPPRRPTVSDGQLVTAEPRPGQGHLELPPNFLPGLRGDTALGPAAGTAVASADTAMLPRSARSAAPRAAQAAPARTAATPPPAAGPADASIVFGSGGTDVPVAADGDVEKVAQRLIADPALRVQVRAYADGADEKDKLQVSLHRALSVRSALIDEGVRSTRIAVQALGGRTQAGPRDRVDLVVMRS